MQLRRIAHSNNAQQSPCFLIIAHKFIVASFRFCRIPELLQQGNNAVGKEDKMQTTQLTCCLVFAIYCHTN